MRVIYRFIFSETSERWQRATLCEVEVLASRDMDRERVLSLLKSGLHAYVAEHPTGRAWIPLDHAVTIAAVIHAGERWAFNETLAPLGLEVREARTFEADGAVVPMLAVTTADVLASFERK
jgi:hypothetical protein